MSESFGDTATLLMSFSCARHVRSTGSAAGSASAAASPASARLALRRSHTLTVLRVARGAMCELYVNDPQPSDKREQEGTNLCTDTPHEVASQSADAQ
jgi:hypothetical protein